MRVIIFDEKPIQLLEHDGRLWLKSADIARALGYSRTNKLGQIYLRHQAEFSPSMTTEIRCLSLGYGQPPIETRLFSLRGAHLLGMFARTSVGVRFRRWVLDQLEQMEQDNIGARSLIAEFYQVKAKLDKQNEFASLCGKGLSEHKRRKPPLLKELDRIHEQIQPSLFLA